ncbi:MFS transporter [Nocardia sp. BMG51109]|uniref:MFS transporter n=1 Tax=Nocardia sp. BMG51109 TaxID=1056816 RepID=UPI000466AE84|nr:MFS transporter [Nocardia sp. BMG51109]
MIGIRRGLTGKTTARAAGLLAVVSAAIFFDALDLSITQVALPAIQSALQVGPGALPWIAAAYVVTYGGFLLLGGRLTDMFGGRTVFLAGLAVFGAASLACGLSGATLMLVVARAVQGVGAALTVPAAVAILAGAFDDERERTRAFGVFAAAASSGFSAGLVFGGLITSGLSWNWIFLAKVPAVVLVLLVAVRVVPGAGRVDRQGGYDVLGALTATAAAVLLTYGVTRAGGPGPSVGTVGLPIALAAVLFAAFLFVERRIRAPLLPLRVLRSPTLAIADLAALTVLAAPFGVSYIVTVYLQDALHRSPWYVALTLLPGAASSAVVARYVAPVLINRWGLRTVFAAGLAAVAVGDAGLLALPEPLPIWVTVVAVVISFGLGMGLAYPAATLGGVHGAQSEDQGSAAGLNNTALQIGGALGLAIVATAMNLGLNGGSIAESSSGTVESAVRYGAAAATALPLLGAVVVLLGLPRRQR